jgi:glycosyltransferase involved in cell wall biosynthesis
VVAYNLDIYQDIYGDYIKKVPLGDIQKFADAIVYFLNHELVMRRFGLEGQKFIEKYDWAEIARKEFQLIVG